MDDGVNNDDVVGDSYSRRPTEPERVPEAVLELDPVFAALGHPRRRYAIAAARGVDPTEVLSPPLYDAVDVPAIEQAFFGSRATDKPGTDPGSLEFRYEEFLVEVKGDGWITVSEQVGPGRSVDDEPVGSR